MTDPPLQLLEDVVVGDGGILGELARELAKRKDAFRRVQKKKKRNKEGTYVER